MGKDIPRLVAEGIGERLNVGQIVQVSTLSRSAVSHHLKLLRGAGLIDCERHGLWAYYFIQRDALAALHERVARQLSRLT